MTSSTDNPSAGLSGLWQRASASTNARDTARRAALLAFAIRVASAGLAYASQVLLARWMGSHEYGIFVFVWVFVLILGGLSSLGLATVTMRFVPTYLERGEHGLARGLLLFSRAAAVATGTVIAALGLGGLCLFGGAIDGHYLLPAYLALACLPLFALTDVQDGIGRAYGRIGVALIPPYVLRPLLILMVMIGARVAGIGMEATTAAAAAIVATWASGLVQLLLIERQLSALASEAEPSSRGENATEQELGAPIGSDRIGARTVREAERPPRRYEHRLWVATAMPILLVYGFELLLQNTDVLILSAYVGPRDVGIYFAALKTISLISFVNYAVGSAVAGQLAAADARGDDSGLKSHIRDAANWTFWPSLGVAVLLLLAGRSLLALFGPEFEAGYPVMVVLVVGLVLRASIGPAEFVLRMLGEQGRCARVLGIAAGLDIVLNLLLVPGFGIMGAAIASSLAMSAAAVMFHAVARQRLGLEIAIWNGLWRRHPVAA